MKYINNFLKHKIIITQSLTFIPFILLFCLHFTSCGSETPEKVFSIAVLNSNALAGFANNGMLRQIESPSEKLVEGSSETVPMKSREIVNSKIEFAETNLKKVNDLKITDDTKEMILASQALYEFVIPVYKTEYIQLAEFYDTGAPKDKIDIISESIHNKYTSRYEELYKNLINTGKKYAEKHNIKVNWGTDQ